MPHATQLNVDSLCVGCFEAEAFDAACPRCGFDAAANSFSQALPARTILHGQYLIGKVLGQGGFGITYLGWDLNLGLKLAVKEYLPTELATRQPSSPSISVYNSSTGEQFQSGLESFLEEARTLARFHDHPGIVSVVNFFRENNTGYLVMSYVSGITFKEYLQRAGNVIGWDTAQRILMPVFDALHEVHAVDVLHRDISPDNIYISNSGQVMLLDFGAARLILGERTRSVSVVLKPGFAPEEQYRTRGKQGPWTDVYALGATFYRAITGITPPSAIDRLVNDELQPPSSLGIVIPDYVERALMTAVSVRADQRFQTVREFQQQLLHPEGTYSIPLPKFDLSDRSGETSHSVATPANSTRRNADSVGASQQQIPGSSAAGLASTTDGVGSALGKLARELLHLVSGTPDRKKRSLIGLFAAAVVLIGYLIYGATAEVQPQLVGIWETQQHYGSTPITQRWKFARGGGYTAKLTYSQQGTLEIDRNGWTLYSSNAGMSGSGQYKFNTPDEIEFSGYPLGSASSLRWKRKPGSPPSGYSFIGSWVRRVEELGFRGEASFTVKESGEYSFSLDAAGEGTFKAREGLWQLNSKNGDLTDNGSLFIVDQLNKRPSSVQLQSSKRGPIFLTRVMD